MCLNRAWTTFAMQIYFTPWIYTPMRSTLTILHQLSKTEVKYLYIIEFENVFFVCLYFQKLPWHVICISIKFFLFPFEIV